jgi:transposase InsO family protein
VYCGHRELHEYELYLDLDLEGIEHTKTKHPQTNGLCERFHQTIQNEFYASAFRRSWISLWLGQIPPTQIQLAIARPYSVVV